MGFSKLFTSSVKLNFVLVISFSIAVNSFIFFPNLNIAFYILFHLTFIYLVFYHYHYYIYILALLYGILFDILLFNNIGVHTISFLIILIFFIVLKKYLVRLSSYQIILIFFVTLIILLLLEQFSASLLNDYKINIFSIINFIIISLIIFIPTIFLFSKLDK